jgi:uncharacterized protein YqhQ
MQRVFEYHGAEHKTIFAFESGAEVTPENAGPFSRLHPRCSTSFLAIVVIISVAVFIFLGRPDSLADRAIRFALIPLIGGISYEVLKASSRPALGRFLGFLCRPGLAMQRMTTREPSREQLEVAIAALDACLQDKILESRHLID